ncbi:unnamed protein product [Heligmosomoides polygyrus]|uniref:Protein Wnt n=1 Tax=Heligmosomoides polygyrus TaxID=6339 RepID=A0A183F8R4_HELPZ|nr:unnamed protein product [Heligmosomoides polygyrus]
MSVCLQVSDAPFSLNGTNISECSSYVYLGREVNMANDLAQELNRRKRAAWGAFKSVEEVVKKMKNVRLRAHLFDSTGCVSGVDQHFTAKIGCRSNYLGATLCVCNDGDLCNRVERIDNVVRPLPVVRLPDVECVSKVVSRLNF